MPIKVLVVDNNPVNLKAISTLLENEGCIVTSATNGLEALECMQHSVPDMLFTDLVMPMVDGEQLCNIVHSVSEYSKVFVVVLSAIITADRERILAEVECDLLIAKGSLVEMRQYLKEALEAYAEKRELSQKLLGEETAVGHARQDIIAKELLIEKQHSRRVVENLSEGVLEINTNGLIVFANQAACSMLQQNKENLIARTITELPWGKYSEQVEKWLIAELQMGGGAKYEIMEDAPLHFEKKYITATFIPVVMENGTFALCTLRDISRQIIAERQREEMDNAIKLIKKMEAMSSMAGGLAHDFNNLLTVICGNLDMIFPGPRFEEGDDRNNCLHNAKQAAFAAVELMRKVSGSSPFGIINRKNRNLIEFVKDVTKNYFTKERKIGYTIQSEQIDGDVYIDQEQIKQALHNVFQNSLEFGYNRPISLLIDQMEIEQPKIISGQYLAQGIYGRVAITDSGPGIEREVLHEVFNPYFSSKERGALKGMGLGLAIVYATLRNHGGYVVIESDPGVGTCVSLYFPLHEKVEDEVSSERINKLVMIVEIDDELRMVSQSMIELLGYSVVAVSTKDEAIRIVQQEVRENRFFCCVLVNFLEAEYRQAMELCEELKRFDSNLKIVGCSTNILDGRINPGKEKVFAETITKPYTIDDLKRVLG